jgi:hypothetical protein
MRWFLERLLVVCQPTIFWATGSSKLFLESIEEWHRFAHAVTLTMPLPHAFGVDKFKVEFERCKEFFVSGSGDADSQKAVERVEWLDEEYARIWSEPKKGT